MRNSKALLSILFSSMLLAACSSTGTVDNSADGQAAATTPSTAPAAAGAPAAAATTDLSKRSVYFDFDRYDVKSEYKPLVQAHAKELNKDSARKVVIQGNADERGGSEYNLALGQKRAEAVRKSMSLQGVSSKRIEVISFGKEKPKAKGHDEASWAENRRADIVY
jgi:peptidoglycan-associated lipoprotein